MPDITAPEQSTQENEPKPFTKNMFRALGKGLHQAFEEEINTFESAFQQLKDNTPKDAVWKEWVDEMEKPDTSFVQLIEGLRTSKKVEIVLLSSGFDFKISPEKEESPELTPEEITLEGNSLEKFLTAFNHRLRTNLTVGGFAELIGMTVKDEKVKKPANDIHRAYSKIQEGLDEFTKPLSKIELSVKPGGKVDITPVPLKKPNNV